MGTTTRFAAATATLCVLLLALSSPGPSEARRDRGYGKLKGKVSVKTTVRQRLRPQAVVVATREEPKTAEEPVPFTPWGRALPDSSECSKVNEGITLVDPPSVLTDYHLGVVESSVKFVGVGLKVPDKDRLFQLLCSYNISTVHVNAACHVSDEDWERHQKLARDWGCLVSGSCSHLDLDGPCTIRDIRALVLEDLMDIVEYSQIEALTGPPYVQVAEELLEMVPTARYIQTLMDPEAWVEYRMQRHIDWPICSQEGLTPFSLFSCRNGAATCGKLPRVHITESHAHLYPLIYNTHMAHLRSLIPPKQLHVACAWDDNLQSLQSSLISLGHPKLDWYFWRHHDQWLRGHLSHMAPAPIHRESIL